MVLQAADVLRFGRGFDRGWPDFCDPIPDELCDSNSYPHVRRTLSYLMERDGLKMEKFEVGAVRDLYEDFRDAKRLNENAMSIGLLVGYGPFRLVAPGVFPPERRMADAGKPFMADVARESFDAGHVVVTVAPGGGTYTVAYVTADDESMRVTGAYDFRSGNNAGGSQFIATGTGA